MLFIEPIEEKVSLVYDKATREQLKLQLIEMIIKYQKLHEKYSALCHNTQFRSSNLSYQNVKAKQRSNEWQLIISKMKQTYQKQIDQLQRRQSNHLAVIQKLKQQIVNMHKTAKCLKYSKDKQQNKQEQLVVQQEMKIQQKNNICKAMMGKIYTLQNFNKSLSQKCSRLQILQAQSKIKELQEKQTQTNFEQIAQYYLEEVQNWLRQQIVQQFYEIFTKSFEPSKEKPNIQIYRNNLELLNREKMKPYCQALDKLLSMNIKNQGIRKINNSKQKWVQASLNNLKQDRKRSANIIDNDLTYLFRINCLFHRINYPLDSIQIQLQPNFLKQFKNQIFQANCSYFFNKERH